MTKIFIQKFPEVLKFSGSVAAACDMTGSLLCAGYSQIVGYVTSSGSLDGTVGLSVEQSVNAGSVWDIVSASQVSATSFTTSCMVDIIGNAVRVRSKNGATKTDNLRMLFQLKPVAGTAKMPDVDIDVVTSIAEITAGSVDIAGALPTGTNSIGDIGTVGTVSSITAGSVDIDGALPTGTNSIGDLGTVGTVSSITAGSVDVAGALPTGTNSIGDVGTVGTLSSITAGSVDIKGALPVGANLIGTVQPFDAMKEVGLTELVGTNEEVNTNDFGAEVGVALGGTYSGELLSFGFYSTDTDTGGSGAVQDSAGELLIFDASPTTVVGATTMSACMWQAVIGKVNVAAADWVTDACAGMAYIYDQPIPFHAVSTLYFTWLHTDATDLNDNAADNEVLEFNAWYRRDS